MKNVVIFLVILGALIALLNHQFPGVLDGDDSKFHLLYLVALMLIISGGVVVSDRSHLKRNLQYATAWVGIFLIFMIGYTYKDVLLDSKLGSELVPGRTTVEADGSMTLHARADGHFYINGHINGNKLLFMIDTGASDMMLTKATAKRVGLQIEEGASKRIYSTANGTSSGLEVHIEKMRVGSFTLGNASAYVNQGDSDTNLLGQSFMNRLSGYSVEDGKMTLVP